ncbi:MAG: 4-hydroxy-tetrahydrodipicolinate synthase [Oscillospiraceae bacterium]
MKNTIFTGAGVAIVTPFDKDNKINYNLLGKLIDRQIDNGTDSIIICGTTGESSTLDHDEHSEAIRFTVAHVGGRVPVIAGTGSNDTAYCLKLSNEAEEAGADALLLVTPYYNKTSQSGLIRQYNYIADRVSTPIILYNVPSRTGVNIKPETYVELAKHERIVAAKEANSDISALAKTISLCGDNLDIYSGNDDQITSFMSLGVKGVISVMSNVIPRVTSDIAHKFLDGDVKGSAKLQLEYLELCNSLFMDVNPIPVKEALIMMGFDVGECRMPLAPLSDSARQKLKDTLIKYNLI